MSWLYRSQMIVVILGLAAAPASRGASPLRKVQVDEYPPRAAATLDIGDLIASGAVQPASAVSIDKAKERCWLLRTTKAPRRLRWYRNLLNTRQGAPDLVIDPGLKGVYDVYAQVRAVNAGGSLGMDAKPEDVFPMAFAIELDDGSKREIVGAKGFPEYHYDTDVLACYRWNLTGRKLVLRNLDKPVYLYGFRFVPPVRAPQRTGRAQARPAQPPAGPPSPRRRRESRNRAIAQGRPSPGRPDGPRRKRGARRAGSPRSAPRAG